MFSSESPDGENILYVGEQGFKLKHTLLLLLKKKRKKEKKSQNMVKDRVKADSEHLLLTEEYIIVFNSVSRKWHLQCMKHYILAVFGTRALKVY